MVQMYHNLFDLYLRDCKAAYSPENPYDNLEVCIGRCESYREQLIGMVNLIAEVGGITRGEADKEIERITQEFCSVSVCNAYKTDGEVMVFVSVSG